MSIALHWSLRYDIASVDDSPSTSIRLSPASPDADVVALAQTGDLHAFDIIVERYRNDVYALCYHFLRNREDAWDAAQETFIKAHRAIKRFRGDAQLKTWLMRIAANHCKDQFKKKRAVMVPLDGAVHQTTAADEANPREALAHSELGRAIEASVAELSDKHRMAFVLREYQGLSYQEMADVMECNIGTVMSRLHHARQKLQKALIRRGVVEGASHA